MTALPPSHLGPQDTIGRGSNGLDQKECQRLSLPIEFSRERSLPLNLASLGLTVRTKDLTCRTLDLYSRTIQLRGNLELASLVILQMKQKYRDDLSKEKAQEGLKFPDQLLVASISHKSMLGDFSPVSGGDNVMFLHGWYPSILQKGRPGAPEIFLYRAEGGTYWSLENWPDPSPRTARLQGQISAHLGRLL